MQQKLNYFPKKLIKYAKKFAHAPCSAYDFFNSIPTEMHVLQCI